MEQLIQQIYSEYPWASEVTADRMAKAVNGGANVRRNIAALFANSISKPAKDALLRALRQENTAQKQDNKATRDLSDSFKNITESTIRDVDGLGGIAKFSESIAEAAAELNVGQSAESAFSKLLNSKSRLIQGIGATGKGMTRFISSTGGMAAGLGVFAATLINSQDKLIKSMIDIGLADANMGAMAEIRRDASRLGLSFQEHINLLQLTKNLTVHSNENALEGAVKFGDFTTRVMNDKNISKFGMRTSDVAMALAETANALYKSNQISSLNPQSQQKIIDTFQTTQEIALGLATATGENRKKILDELTAQRESQELNTSFRVAEQQYIQNFGEESFDNFVKSTRFYLAGIATQYGRDSALYREVEKTFQAAVFDINHDQTIVNNLTPELVQMFNEIGGNTLQQFIDTGNSILTGQKDQQGAVLDVSKLTAIISEQGETRRRQFSVDATTMSANETMSQAQLVIDQAKTLSLEKLEQAIDTQTSAVEAADDSINAVDNMARAFSTTLEALMPGFDTMDSVIDLGYQTAEISMAILSGIGKVFSIGGGNIEDLQTEMVDMRAEISKFEPKDIVVYDVGSAEYNRSDALMRATPDGPITAYSIAAYLSTKDKYLTQSQIKSSSRETLTERLDQLERNNTAFREQEQSATSTARANAYRQSIRITDEQIAKITAQLADLEEGSVIEGGVQ